MRAIHVSIRQIGNSQGVVIPKPVLAQLGLDASAGVEMTIEDGALVLRRPASPARTGWAEAARSIAESGDGELVMGEFVMRVIQSWSGDAWRDLAGES
jgi:antitoxin MazE